MKREEVEKGLEVLVNTCKEEFSLLREIRIYGSYNDGKWDSTRSDVDIFIEFDEDRTQSRSFADINTIGSNDEQIIIIEMLMRSLKGKIDEPILGRFSIHTYTSEELKFVEEPLRRNMKEGRLIYPLIKISDFKEVEFRMIKDYQQRAEDYVGRLKSLPINLFDKYAGKEIKDISRRITIYRDGERFNFMVSDAGFVEDEEDHLNVKGERLKSLVGVYNLTEEDFKPAN